MTDRSSEDPRDALGSPLDAREHVDFVRALANRGMSYTGVVVAGHVAGAGSAALFFVLSHSRIWLVGAWEEVCIKAGVHGAVLLRGSSH